MTTPNPESPAEPPFEPSIASLALLGRPIARLCEPRVLQVPQAAVYCDIGDFNPAFGAHVERDTYPARGARLEAVDLVALPSNATVIAGTSFATRVGDQFVAEQMPPVHLRTPEVLQLLRQKPVAEEVDAPCLLVARFGGAVWGHWLGELLPRAVLAEQAFPGRFRFVVPRWTDHAQWGPRWHKALTETLLGHGIGEERLLWLDPSRSVRFSQLFCISSVWSDRMMHPIASAAMRQTALNSGTAPSGRRLAIVRELAAGRTILNATDVYRHLADRGFVAAEVGRMSYLDQVATFRRAEHVFGVLGSDLTGLIHAPDHVAVVSAAPATFGDRFFYAMIQLRHGRYADLRGAAVPNPKRHINYAAFEVDMRRLDTALEIVGSSVPTA